MKYIICAPSYDENNGGAIFLHQLGKTLISFGETAEMWPMPPLVPKGKRQKIAGLFQPKPEYKTLDVPVFKGKTAPDDAVIVYPELVLRNPLNARNIVRWILYKPGILHPYDFTENEMFFHCGEMFDVPELTGGAPELVMWRRNRTYKNEHRPDRKGTAYIVKKGFAKDRLPETEDPQAIAIDGLSHAEINDIFNRVDTFISYDEATMYSQFAAICGCDSIIVPGFFPDQDTWQASHPLAKYGVAYGFENIEHARATRDKVQGMLDAREEESLETVRNFVRLTKERFGMS